MDQQGEDAWVWRCWHNTTQGTLDVGPHAGTLTKGITSYSLPQFGDRDTTTVCLSFKAQNREQWIVVGSIYMPTEEQLPTTMLE